MRLPQSAANKAPLSSTRYRPCRLHGRSFRRHRESEISLQSGTRGPCCTAPRNFLAPSRGQNEPVSNTPSRQEATCPSLPFKQTVATRIHFVVQAVLTQLPSRAGGFAFSLKLTGDGAECQLFRQLQTVLISGQ